MSSKTVRKVEQIHPTAALTLVGSLGGAQSFIGNLRAEVDLYEARRGRGMSISALATLAGNFARVDPSSLSIPSLAASIRIRRLSMVYRSTNVRTTLTTSSRSILPEV